MRYRSRSYHSWLDDYVNKSFSSFSASNDSVDNLTVTYMIDLLRGETKWANWNTPSDIKVRIPVSSYLRSINYKPTETL